MLGVLTRGHAFGEMSSLTGELRSATVIAKTNVDALVIADADFDRLRERRPRVALALVRLLSKRLGEAEKNIEALLEGAMPDKEAPKVAVRRGSVRRVWQELVAGRGRDLAFLALASFVITLALVRATVYVSFRFDFAPRDVLRTAYMTGFALVLASSAASVLTFRPSLRRILAIAYGIGGALIVNELGVTLAFDIFYKDIHTPDPEMPSRSTSSVLYRRHRAASRDHHRARRVDPSRVFAHVLFARAVHRAHAIASPAIVRPRD